MLAPGGLERTSLPTVLQKKRPLRTVEPHSGWWTVCWSSALNSILEQLAGGEGGNALGRDLDLVAGLGVETLTS